MNGMEYSQVLLSKLLTHEKISADFAAAATAPTDRTLTLTLPRIVWDMLLAADQDDTKQMLEELIINTFCGVKSPGSVMFLQFLAMALKRHEQGR